MRQRLGTTELLAILSVAGISCNTVAQATQTYDGQQRIGSMRVQSAAETADGSRKEASCGGRCSKCAPGACGVNYYAKLKAQKKRHHSTFNIRKARVKKATAPAVAAQTVKSIE